MALIWNAEHGWHDGPAMRPTLDGHGRLRLVPDLSAIMEFDHVIRVHADGTVTDAPEHYAPECTWNGYGEGQHLEPGSPWSLLTGYTGQYGYRGPIMHASEFIGGRMARDILETPGLYVAVVCDVLTDDDDDDADPESAGWAVAYIAD